MNPFLSNNVASLVPREVKQYLVTSQNALIDLGVCLIYVRSLPSGCKPDLYFLVQRSDKHLNFIEWGDILKKLQGLEVSMASVGDLNMFMKDDNHKWVWSVFMDLRINVEYWLKRKELKKIFKELGCIGVNLRPNTKNIFPDARPVADVQFVIGTDEDDRDVQKKQKWNEITRELKADNCGVQIVTTLPIVGAARDWGWKLHYKIIDSTLEYNEAKSWLKTNLAMLHAIGVDNNQILNRCKGTIVTDMYFVSNCPHVRHEYADHWEHILGRFEEDGVDVAVGPKDSIRPEDGWIQFDWDQKKLF